MSDQFPIPDYSTYNDKWPNGQSINRVVLPTMPGQKKQSFVQWNTPEGQRLFTTLTEYNDKFPQLWDAAKEEMAAKQAQ